MGGGQLIETALAVLVPAAACAQAAAGAAARVTAAAASTALHASLASGREARQEIPAPRSIERFHFRFSGTGSVPGHGR